MKNYNPLIHGHAKAWDDGRKCYFDGGGGSSGGGTSVTKQEIPEELKPLATAYTDKAITLGNKSYNPYQGQRDAALNPTQTSAIGMIQDRATTGSATNANAEGQLNQFIQGGTNPYLDATYAKAADQVSNSVNSNFSQAGRYGSGAQTDVLSQNLGDLATNIYGGAYAQDRSNQMQAIGMAPQFGDLAYKDAGQLLNAGQVLQDDAQNPLDFRYGQYQEEENLPYKQLAGMSGVFGSNLGSSSTSQQSGGGGGGK